MKLRRTHAFLVFKISEDGSQIVVDTSLTSAEAARLGSEATYDRFVATMPAQEGRYGVYDLEYDQGLDGVRSKLIFVSWNPNEGKIRSRMMYASSKGALRQRLDGIHSEVQCTDASELAFESLFEAAAPKGTTPVIKAAKEE
nr:cofilin [Polyrhizophydium stewartii]